MQTGAMDKSPDAFKTISEVADDLDLPQHVLRFWETRFAQIKPLKRGGGRRYYRPDDVALLRGIRTLLYGEGYTIKGVQRILKENGIRSVQAIGRGENGELPQETSYAAGTPNDAGAPRQTQVPGDIHPEKAAYPVESVYEQPVVHDEPPPVFTRRETFERQDDRQSDLFAVSDPPDPHIPQPVFAPPPQSEPIFSPQQPFAGGPLRAERQLVRPAPSLPADTPQVHAPGHPVHTSGIGSRQIQRLHRVLDELLECRRLLQSLRGDTVGEED